MRGDDGGTRPPRLADRRRQGMGMAGYVTDSDVQRWRRAGPGHPPGYGPPRAGDYIKAALWIALTMFTAWLWMHAMDMLVPSCWW